MGIARQVLNSGTSIGANVEEGRASLSRRDLAAKFAIAILTVSVRKLRAGVATTRAGSK
jgi:four helix bundle protein